MRREVARREDVVLQLLAEPRGDLEGMIGGQAGAPGGAHVAAPELHPDAHERRYVYLQPAVAAGNVHPVETGIQQGLMDVLRVIGALLGLGLLTEQLGAQGADALYQFVANPLHPPSLPKSGHRTIL